MSCGPKTASQWSGLLAFIGLMISATALQAAPQITEVSPRTVRSGEAIDVTITGSDLAGATELWLSFPGKSTLAPNVKNNGKDASRVVFRVEPEASASVGVHAVRVITDHGISALKFLVVDDLPTVAQTANNKSPAQAQAVSLPVGIDGRVDNLSLNYYRFSVAAGQRVSMEVLARRMGSALDPMIRLFKADGRELAYNDDAPGLIGDARLCHTFQEDGDYILEVRDIRFQGGGNHFYRLRIGDFPCVNVPYPLGVQRGQSAKLTFAGPDVSDVEPLSINVPSNAELKWMTVGAKRTGGNASGFATVSVGDVPEVLEVEPNNALGNATPAALPCHFNGRLQEAGDVDRFKFTAKKGEKIRFAAVTRSQGSPVDAVLQLFNAKGQRLSQIDDVGTEDAILDATFPADGEYQLHIEDLHGRGGSQFAYRIAISRNEPGFSLHAISDRLNIPAGGVGMIQLSIGRANYNGPIAIKAENLPAGVTLCPATVPTGQRGINLCLKSTKETQPGAWKNLKILGEATIASKQVTATADIAPAIKAKMNQFPYEPGHLVDHLAVGVTSAGPFTLRTEPETITFGRDLSARFKVIADRQKDFSEPISLAIPTVNIGTAKPIAGLPANVTAALKPIPKDKNEIEITLTANNKAALGTFPVVLEGSLKKGNVTHKHPAPTLTLKLQPAYKLTVEPATITLKPEGKMAIKVTVERNPAMGAAIDITFKNLPAGVTAAKANIAADQTETTIELTATKDAKPAMAKNVTAEGQATVGKAKLAATSAAFVVTVKQ